MTAIFKSKYGEEETRTCSLNPERLNPFSLKQFFNIQKEV